MWSKVKKLFSTGKHNAGFTLIEAMVSSALVGIGFAGVITLVVTSDQIMARAMSKQKAQMVADQVMEIIETDLDNIDSYSMGLTTCTDPGVSTNVYDIRGYEWCIRLAAILGDAGTTNTRAITITTLADGRKVVHITFEGSGGRVQVVMKRAFDV